MHVVALPILFAMGLVAGAAEPVSLEIHGQLDGTPFWARWQIPSAEFAGHRALQLVYTPPTPELLDGAHLIDCPFILLDERARILAWNGRDSLSFLAPLDKGRGYRVSREIANQAGGDKPIQTQELMVASGLQWDLRLLPIHLALVWTATGTGHETAMDLFAAKTPPPTDVRWAPGVLTVGAVTWHVEADSRGFIGKLMDDANRCRLQVAERKP